MRVMKSLGFFLTSGYLDDEKIPYFGVRQYTGGIFLQQDDKTKANVQEHLLTSSR